jgi:hypothetical protein
MAHLVARSTCGGGRPKSGEDNLTVSAGQGLGSILERLHGLSGKLSKGSGEVGALREWLATAVGLWRRRQVVGRLPKLRAGSGKLGAVRREWQGGWLCMRVSFIAARGHETGMGVGRVDRARGRALQWPVRA